MSQTQAGSTLLGGVALLERSISYTLGNLQLVTADALAWPTPCRAWDLKRLLAHMIDSLITLQEAADLGQIRLAPETDSLDPIVDPVTALRSRACRLLGAWTSTDRIDSVSIGGCALTTGMVTRAGAIEVAIHGWDVAQACGHPRELPASLAEELVGYAPAFVTRADRPVRFAEAVDPPPWASAGERLLAFLGRDPRQESPSFG